METEAQEQRSTQSRRRAPILGAAALFMALGGRALAADRTVHVGQGGMQFVDEVSATKTSTIQVGDTVTWVWEGSMNHSVTSGSCDNGGGGGGGYIYGGGGGCTASHAWDSGLHPAGFTFSRMFSTEGTFSYYCEAHGSSMQGKVIVQAATTAGACAQEPEVLCLNDGRFKVTTEWEKTDGTSGHGTGTKLTGDSGHFYFFDPANVEVVVKVLNACGLNPPAYWVFAAGLTNVAVHVEVTDTQTGAVFTQDNSQGSPFQPIQDTRAFLSSCP